YPQHGLLSSGLYGDFTYTPYAGFVGTDSFTYTAQDGSVTSDAPATVTLTVVPPANDPSPTLQTVPDKTIYPGQSWLDVVLEGTDADGDVLTYSAQAQPQPYWLSRTYGLYQDPGGYYTNQRGQN